MPHGIVIRYAVVVAVDDVVEFLQFRPATGLQLAAKRLVSAHTLSSDTSFACIIPIGSAYNRGRVADEGAQKARVDIVEDGVADANVLDVVDDEPDVWWDIGRLDGAQVDCVNFRVWTKVGDCKNNMSA